MRDYSKAIVLIILLLIFMIVGLLSSGEVSYIFLALGLPLLVISYIYATSEHDIFSPLYIIFYSMLFSIALRAFYIVGYNTERRDFISFGMSSGEVIDILPLVYSSMLAMLFGYHINKVGWFYTICKRFSKLRVSEHRLRKSSLVGIIAGAIGIVLYFWVHGISIDQSLGALSRKRAIEVAGGGFAVGGYLMLFSQLSQYVYLTLIGYLLYSKKHHNGMYILVIMSFVLALVVPFVSSTRSSIIMLLIIPLVMANYFRKIKIYQITIAVVFCVVVVQLMGELRSINQTGYNQYTGTVDSIAGSGNGLDLFRTAAIIEQADVYDIRLNGESYLALFTSFIPKSLWADKPNPSLGPWVKSELFGYSVRTNGMPPGVIAEGYLNFGYFGAVIVMFVFGCFIKGVYLSFKPWLGVSFFPTLFYSVMSWRLSFGCFGLNIAQGVLQALLMFVPIYIFSIFIRRAQGDR